MKPIVVAITGASGSLYAVRLLEVLLSAGRDVHLTISPAAGQVFEHELGLKLDLKQFDLKQLVREENVAAVQDDESANALSSIISKRSTGSCTYYAHQDYNAGIASGSFRTDGMVICPCSMGTLASLASGMSSNLIQRAAHVHLKERRKLIIVPRETPLSTIHLRNMTTLSEAGAVILPAMPGFYHDPVSIPDLVDFIVARICDQLDVEHKLTSRWGE